MPFTRQTCTTSQPPSTISLTDTQQRVILLSLLDLHRRLSEMESLLVQSESSFPLGQYVNDLSSVEVKAVRDHFERLRARMLACLEEAGITPEIHRSGLRWALQVHLTALHVVVAEMNPKTLDGYGPLSEEGRLLANKIQDDIKTPIESIQTCLRQGPELNVGERSERAAH